MATDAIITLERLRCIRESDASGHSEPYIWPALLWIDDNTIATPELVGVTAPALGNARVVIKNDMSAGQTADIPTSVGMLRVRFEDGLTIRRPILVVALWEEDETPEAAMRAGFQAFSTELRAAVADNLFALGQASEEEEDAIIETIKTQVKDRVKSAIENGLTGWQKARVFVGTLNLDDIIDSDFRNFRDLVATSFTLAFRASSSDEYLIEGNLQVQPVRLDRCQAEVNAVQAAQSVVDGIDAEIRQLQDELQHASPSEKPYINKEIKRLREEELPDAMASLEDARRALETCRRTGQLLSYGDAGTPGNVSAPVVVGFGGWLDFKFLFSGRNLSGENRIYAVDQNGQLLSYGDAGTPGNVSAPVVVGFGGWSDFKFLFAGGNLSGENRIYAVVA